MTTHDNYRLIRSDDDVYDFVATNIGVARSTIEETYEDDIEPGDGFRWIHVLPETWRFQIFDEETLDVKFSVDLQAV